MLSKDKIDDISNNGGFDKEKFKDMIFFIKFVGPKAFKDLAKEKIMAFEDFDTMSEEKINKMVEIDKEKLKEIVDYVKIIGHNIVRKLLSKNIGRDNFLNMPEDELRCVCEDLKIDFEDIKKRKEKLK